MKTISFTIACKNFFGMKTGETLAEFSAEIKALTPADREEMAPLLGVALGCYVTD